MKFLTFTFFIFLSFSVYANCAAPVELVLSVDENELGTVVLKYGYSTKDSGNFVDDSNFIYRAGVESGSDDYKIFQLPFNENAYPNDDYLIAIEECVPPGEWTYVIPFSCYSASCGCKNYATIIVENYESECQNGSEESNISREDLQEKKKDESWYGEGPDGPSNPDKSDGCSIVVI